MDKQLSSSVLSRLYKKYPYSRVSFDINRSRLARKALENWENNHKVTDEEQKSYFVNAINPYNTDELSELELSRTQKIYQNGANRIFLIDEKIKNYINSSNYDRHIINTGGACALESVDIKIIRYLKKRGLKESDIKKYIKELLDRAPTWTQITGSLLPVKGVNIFYDETFPWYKTISEYSIQNPELTTQRVYDDIFVCVSRYIRLYDPNNILLRVPFTDLKLDSLNKLNEWFDLYKSHLNRFDLSKENNSYIEPNELFKLWIEYTYSGPDILDITKNIIKQKYPEIFKQFNLHEAQIHVRGKQIDHLDVERSNQWVHYFMFNNSTKLKNSERVLRNPVNRQLLAMYTWIRESRNLNTKNGFVGFIDHNVMGRFMHEDIFLIEDELSLLSKEELIPTLLDSPLRLHSKNLTRVLELLKRFITQQNFASSSRDVKLTNLNTQKLVKLRLKAERVSVLISRYDDFIASLVEYVKSTKIDRTGPSKAFSKFNEFIKRYKNNAELKRFLQEKDVKQNLEIVLNNITEPLLKSSAECSFSTRETEEIFKQWISVLKYDRDQYKAKYTYLEVEHDRIQKDINKSIEHISNFIFKKKKDQYAKCICILPLVDNLFFSYMFQLSFIPVINKQLQIMIATELDNNMSILEKEGIIIECMIDSYPKVEESLRYIFEGRMGLPPL